MLKNNKSGLAPRVAVIGGGVAGATAALHMAELGVQVRLIEKRDSLVNGPPICHLHAGGNLYREISLQQCIELLHQSIDIVRLFPHTLNERPTIIATPLSDGGEPNELLERLNTIKTAYKDLVELDSANKVLGEPSSYFKTYSRSEIEALIGLDQPERPSTFDDWMIPFASGADLDALKYPVIAVQEYGWSVFRLAASATLAFESLSNCSLHFNTSLIKAVRNNEVWELTTKDSDGNQSTFHADYLVNACGYLTGTLDDMVEKPRNRLVEFKAAYVSHWDTEQQYWPEVIFHGERGTPKGMAQLTPYPNGVFQLHGMTKDITLFENGLVSSTGQSSQPVLPSHLKRKINLGWTEQVANERTGKAIAHMSQMIPDYASATPLGTPLFGAQQIPGQDDTLRSADVTFEKDDYARVEVVKGSSALEAARKMVSTWKLYQYSSESIEELHPVTLKLTAQEIESRAEELATQRGYPKELAKFYPERI
ncbi:FAD-dependent oxidoreductase [Vibrio sonorensis]|uniref:FAD-dependent oxidoreductase n=1 Tax=Vibrio sonorensis TaxID=1004316 RepID=UPI0008D93F38|nr:FAD-dependent oxidoreductase [Vibrio sonorensis]